jgi:predicted dienelactone hydrolase
LRPVETILLLANLLTFFILAVPRLRAMHWTGYLAPITLLVAIAQVLLEGPRWQMYPAYAITVLLFLVWMFYNRESTDSHSMQKGTNRLAPGLAIGTGILILTVSIALPIMFPVFSFPHPSGPYEIGTLTYHWVDTNRQEVFSKDPNAHRELMVQVWYPTKGNLSSPRAPYMQDTDAVAPALARLEHVPEFTFEHLKYVTTNAIPSAPITDNNSSYPVLIFLEGLDGFRQMNTFQVEELVSHGYIVAAIDQPYAAASVVFSDGHRVAGMSKSQLNALIQQSINPVESAPILNGRVFNNGIIPYFAQDVSFTLDRLAALNQSDPNGILTGNLDLQRAGIFGISLGCVVGSEACHLDPRLQACLLMDAYIPADVVQNGLQQPTMLMTRDVKTMQLEGWSQSDITQTQTTMREAFEKSPQGEGYLVQILGMFHLNFTDIPYWSPIFSWLGITGPIDGQRGQDIVNAYSLAFFDRYLKGSQAELLNGSTSPYHEVIFEVHNVTLPGS